MSVLSSRKNNDEMKGVGDKDDKDVQSIHAPGTRYSGVDGDDNGSNCDDATEVIGEDCDLAI